MTARRPAVRLSSHAVLVALIIATGVVLRFWGLSSGIPYAVGVDEPVIMGIAVRMMQTGDFNPAFFDYPTLFIYLQVATASLRFMAGASQGLWQSVSEVGPEHFYLWGRSVTALFGVATIAVVYAAGRYFGRVEAVVGAAVMATLPLHVRESHYTLTDVPATFFVMLTLLLSLRASARPSNPIFLAAGIAAGLGVATKYNVYLGAVMPILAVLGLQGDVRIKARYAAIAIAGCAVAFLVAAPYTVIELPRFLDGFARLSAYYVVKPGQEPPWSVYLKHLRMTLIEPGMLVFIVGLAYALYRSIGRQPRWWLVAFFPIAYFAFLSRQGLVFGRYLLPMVPFAALSIGIAVVVLGDWGARMLRREWTKPAVQYGLAAIVVALMLNAAVGFNRTITQPSTQALAFQWIQQNVPSGSRVVSERFEVRLPEKQYRVDFTPRLTDADFDTYKQRGVQYFVATSAAFAAAYTDPKTYSAEYAAYERLFGQSRELFRVTPSDSVVGPEIRIYALSNDPQR